MTGRSRLVLASSSPQRRAILEQLGIPFTVAVPGVEELTEGEPEQLVIENALRKARAVEGERVLGVDTAVVLEGNIFGKPRDEREARAFLSRLAGVTHQVWSGLALIEAGEASTAAAVTSVSFRTLEQPELDWYLASGEWRERAGGYAIQGRGAALVERIEGDYTNVVGLPVAQLVRIAPTLLEQELVTSDRKISQAIDDLLDQGQEGGTILPSQVARKLGGEYWRELMPRVREVAAERAEANELELRRGGERVDPRNPRGPVRLARPPPRSPPG